METRSVGFFNSGPDTKCVPVRAFSGHKLIRFLDCQVSQKVVREQLGATALRATYGVRRGELRAGGRSAPSPGLLRGVVWSSSRLQYDWLAVAAALRTLPVIPNSRHSPLKMGPRGSRGALAAPRWCYHAGRRRHEPRGAPTNAYTPRGRGWLPVSGVQALSPRAHARFANPTAKHSARFPLYGPDAITAAGFLCFPMSLHGFKELTRDDVN